MKHANYTLVRSALCAAIVAGAATTAVAAPKPLPVAPVTRATPVDFQNEILPIFRNNCLACHNRTKAKGDLILETPKDILAGKAVTPGDALKSLLFKMASHMEDPVMPPLDNKVSARSLEPQELGLLKLWIEQGAKGEVRAARNIEWQPLPAGLNPIYSVAVTADGQYAAAGRANQIFIYHLPTKTLAARLTDDALLKNGLYKQGVAHLDMVHSLDFNHDGTLLASGGYREVKLWRKQVDKPLRALPINSDTAILDVSPDGKWLAAAEGNDIKLIDFATGTAAKTFAGHKAPVSGLSFSPDNTRLLSGAQDGNFTVWTVADGKAATPTLDKPVKINAVAWATSGKVFVTAQEDGLIRSWLFNDKPEKPVDAIKAHKELKGHTLPVAALARVASAPSQILSGSKDGTVRHWDADAGTSLRSMSHGTPVTGVAASPDGLRFASASENNTARVWNAATGAQVSEVRGQREPKLDQGRKDRLATFAKGEVTYHTGNVKAKQDAQKTADERIKKSDEAKKKAEAMPIAEKKTALDKAVAEKKVIEDSLVKFKTDIEAAGKEFEAADTIAKDSETAAGKAKADAVAPTADATAKAADVTAKKTAAAAAMKQVETLVTTQQKPAETKLAAEQKAVVDDGKASKDADKALTDAKASAVTLTADATAKATDATAKKTAAATALKQVETLTTTQQKPAETKLVAEQKAAVDADKVSKDADKALTDAKANHVKAQLAFTTTDTTAKTAEAAAKVIAADATKKPEDKDKANKDAAEKRKLADADKVIADKAKAAETLAQTAATTAAQKLVLAQAAVKTTETALVAIKTLVATATTAHLTAEKASVDAAKLADATKVIADKAKAAEALAQTAATTAAQKLVLAQAAVKATETALAAIKTLVATATTAHQAAEKASVDATKLADAAKVIADKAKLVQADAEKLAEGKRKLATDVKAKQTKLNTDQQAAQTKLTENTKTVTTAETEFKKLEDPRLEAVNEFTLATKAKTQVDEAVKKAEADKLGADNTQKLTDAAAVAAKETVTKAEKPMRAVAFSTDGQILITGGDDNMVQTWAAQDGQTLGAYAAHTGAVKALVFTAAGQLLSAGADKSARVWDLVPVWKLERTLGTGDSNSPIADRVNAIDFSVDGQFVATGSGEPSRGGEIKVWVIADGKLHKDMTEVHSDAVLGLEFSRDGKYMASASADKFVKVTDLTTGKVAKSFEGHTHHALGVAWHPHGRQIISTGADKSVRHWNFEIGERVGQRVNFGKEVTAICYVGFTDQAVVAAGDKTVRLINASNLNDVRSFAGGTDYMYACAATPDAQFVVAGGQDSTLRVWMLANAQVVASFEAPAAPGAPKKEEKK